MTGLYADILPPQPTVERILVECVAAVNLTQGTNSDEQMARALQRELERRGVVLVDAGER